MTPYGVTRHRAYTKMASSIKLQDTDYSWEQFNIQLVNGLAFIWCPAISDIFSSKRLGAYPREMGEIYSSYIEAGPWWLV